MSFLDEISFQPSAHDAVDRTCAEIEDIVPANPEDAANAVVSNNIGTCDSFVRHVAHLIYLCFDRFKSGEDLARFSRQLERRGFLSARDAVAPERTSSKLSMLKKVGKHADIFCDPRVLPFLAPEHSKLYQLALLLELLECSTERFVVELKRLGPDFTRDDVMVRIAEIKADTPPQDTSGESDPAEHSASSPVAGDTIPLDLVAGTVTANDARILRRDPVDPAEWDRLLPRPNLSESAALVVLTKLSELSVVETRLAPHLGFSRTIHVFAVGDTNAIDLIDQQVMVVATRGKTDCAVPEAPIPTSDSPGDSAVALFGNAERKFQLFSDCDAGSGWKALRWNEG
ncbi:MAG: hypothetical protein IH582_17975 [Afipia sp.]|nr:hypothetical protein [Afipia sp.]